MELKISSKFNIDDIHKIREYNYEKTKNLSNEEYKNYYNLKGREYYNRLKQLKK